MVREEYLNMEFMYKFINELCKRDGYIMNGFTFGMLNHTDISDASWVLQNGHGYNMVYKFDVYELPKKLNVEYVDKKATISHEMFKGCNPRTFLFDLSSEIIVDYDKKNTSFVEFPPFFRLNNQLYYGVYDQPKVLKYHFSPARDMLKNGCFSKYLCEMRIDVRNFMTLEDMVIKYVDDRYDWNRLGTGCFGGRTVQYDSKEEAEKDLMRIIQNREDWLPISVKTLPIHKEGTPVFYTDNVLELTVPLAQEIHYLNERLDCVLRSIGHCLMLIRYQIEQLMELRLGDMKYHALALAVANGCAGRQYSELTGGAKLWLVNKTYRAMLAKENPEGFARNLQTLATAEACVGTNIDGVIRTYKMCQRLEDVINKLNPSTMSVNSMVDISRMLDKLLVAEKQKVK